MEKTSDLLHVHCDEMYKFHGNIYTTTLIKSEIQRIFVIQNLF